MALFGAPIAHEDHALRACYAALEELYADRLAEEVDRLAHHALRGEVWDKAEAACRQAGTKAITHSAYREAVTYFEQARAELSTTITLYRAMDMHFWLPQAEAALAQTDGAGSVQRGAD